MLSIILKLIGGFIIGIVGRFLLHQVWVLTADSIILLVWRHARAYANPKPDHPTKSPLVCPDCQQALYDTAE